MARMLGNTPSGRHSVCNADRCWRKTSEDVEYRRSQRAREAADVRRYVAWVEAGPWWSAEDPLCDDD